MPKSCKYLCNVPGCRFLVVFLFLVVPFTMLWTSAAGAEMQTISPQEANTLIKSRGDDLLILDVRTPEERAQGTIAGSRLVSIWDIAYNRVRVPEDRPLLVFCATGARSYMAGQVLDKRGDYQIFNLSGGIGGWAEAGLPVVMPDSPPSDPQEQ